MVFSQQLQCLVFFALAFGATAASLEVADRNCHAEDSASADELHEEIKHIRAHTWLLNACQVYVFSSTRSSFSTNVCPASRVLTWTC